MTCPRSHSQCCREKFSSHQQRKAAQLLAHSWHLLDLRSFPSSFLQPQPREGGGITAMRTDDSVRQSESQVPEPSWVGTGLCYLPFTPPIPFNSDLGLQTQAQEWGQSWGSGMASSLRFPGRVRRAGPRRVWSAQEDTLPSPALPPVPHSRQRGQDGPLKCFNLLIAPRLTWAPPAPLPSSLHVHLLSCLWPFLVLFSLTGALPTCFLPKAYL